MPDKEILVERVIASIRAQPTSGPQAEVFSLREVEQGTRAAIASMPHSEQVQRLIRARMTELELQGDEGPNPKADAAEYDELEAFLKALTRNVSPHSEQVEAARAQGQSEGFAAAIAQLRDLSAQKPPATLWHAASMLADSLEQSRIPCEALTRNVPDKENGDADPSHK